MTSQEVDEFRAGLLGWFLADKPIKHKAFANEKVSVENLLKHYCVGPTLARLDEAKNSIVPYRNW